MRIVVVGLCVLLVAGCALPKSQPPQGGQQDKVIVTPVDRITGRVALVNRALRYVVIDFSRGRVPAADQLLNVYRLGKKVAEVKVSGQSDGRNFAADILAGEVRVGDEARED
jgi:hypothetical protein